MTAPVPDTPPATRPPGGASRRRVAARVGVMFVSLLVSVELALAWVPHWIAWRFEAPATGDAAALILLGDSVTFGFGVRAGEGWGARLPAALAERGFASVKVQNLAQAATGTQNAVATVSDRGTDGATYLAMTGHNDFVRWNNVINTHQAVAQGGLPAAAVPWIPRVFRLGWYVLEGRSVQATLDPASVAAFHTSVRRLLEAVQHRGGRLVLLTYAVPGPPGPNPPTDPVAMAVVRDGQLAINRLLRTEAAAAHIPLIDVEAAVPASATWSSAEYLDVIHPTAATHARIADAVATAIVAEGIVPAPP